MTDSRARATHGRLLWDIISKSPPQSPQGGKTLIKDNVKSCVGIIVKLKNGATDYIFSSPQAVEMRYKGMKVKGKYAVIRDAKKLIEK